MNRNLVICFVAAIGSIAVASPNRDAGQQFTVIDVPASVGGTQAYGINERGDIVGFWYTGTFNGTRGFLLSEGKFTTIQVPNSLTTGAFGINSRRDVVGVFTDNAGGHGFLLTKGNYLAIDVPGASHGSGRHQ